METELPEPSISTVDLHRVRKARAMRAGPDGRQVRFDEHIWIDLDGLASLHLEKNTRLALETLNSIIEACRQAKEQVWTRSLAQNIRLGVDEARVYNGSCVALRRQEAEREWEAEQG